jgi:hypothetical protein
MTSYVDFLASKRQMAQSTGFVVEPSTIHPRLFPFQRDIVLWALKRGRAAIFADTGLGKTTQQVEWARHVVGHTGGDVLIIAPLAVGQQTVGEARLLDVAVTLCREATDVRPGVNITNYDRLHKFDPRAFAGIVLDESSILKSYDGKMRTALIEGFGRTPYRLACTATPAPNDTMELGNHTEFLGVLSRSEMLAMYFTHDGGETQKWRLKGHAERDFWTWVATWAAVLKRPSDLGYDDAGFDLPPLNMLEHVVESDVGNGDTLFALEAQGLNEQRIARRGSIAKRVERVAEIVSSDPGPWLIWCDFNAEADATCAAIPGAVEVRGTDDAEDKERNLLAFAAGEIAVMISKPSICGFGMNFQACSKMAFVGISNSYEQFYQAVRRCWRFGQTKPVDAHVVCSSAELAVLRNIKRKEREAERLSAAMVREAAQGFIEAEHRRKSAYEPPQIEVPAWLKAS